MSSEEKPLTEDTDRKDRDDFSLALNNESANPVEAHFSRIAAINQIIRKYGLLPLSDDIVYKLAELGIKPVGPDAIEHSNLQHSFRVLCGAFPFTESMSPEKARNEKTAALLHDIGKGGPSECSFNPGENSFVKFYNIDFKPEMFSKKTSPRDTMLTEALKLSTSKKYTTEEDAARIFRAAKDKYPGKNPEEITHRDFYNLHSYHTYKILKQTNLPSDVISLASNLHLTRGFCGDPNCSPDDPEVAIKTVRLEIVDKITALLRRIFASEKPSKETIKKAINAVRTSIKSDPNETIQKIYGDFLDEMMQNGTLTKVIKSISRKEHQKILELL